VPLKEIILLAPLKIASVNKISCAIKENILLAWLKEISLPRN